MRKNIKAVEPVKTIPTRLAGGAGGLAAKQSPEALLRRLVMANLLWEDLAYIDGVSASDQIKKLIPQVDPDKVSRIAIEARKLQKLRHVPLFIVREMAKLDTHKSLVGRTLYNVVDRTDELAEFLSLYWNGKKQPLSAQVKKGLGLAFTKFDEYQLAKYNRDNEVKLRDVLFLSHAEPLNDEQDHLWKRLIGGYCQKCYGVNPVSVNPKSSKQKVCKCRKFVEAKLATPDTWEVGLSTGEDKAEVFTHLITDKKLGALAFLKNLRGMVEAGVSRKVILQGFKTVKPSRLLPIDFLRAAKAAPDWENEIEDLMYSCLGQFTKLQGWSIFVVDVSGSMGTNVSDKSESSRIDVAACMAILAREMCEHVTVYVTAGSDGAGKHKTEKVKSLRGFALMREIVNSARHMGGGGIFTRQCLEYIKAEVDEVPDRIMIFSDSQDCDRVNKTPKPFGKRNYICDVSANRNGVNYKGIWTAEISGWSEHFLNYIAELENNE